MSAQENNDGDSSGHDCGEDDEQVYIHRLTVTFSE
jgi:hypothetical protein